MNDADKRVSLENLVAHGSVLSDEEFLTQASTIVSRPREQYPAELIDCAEDFCLAHHPDFDMVCGLPPNHADINHVATCGKSVPTVLVWPV